MKTNKAVRAWQRFAKAEPSADLQKHLDGYASFLMLAISVIAIRVERTGRMSLGMAVDELTRTPAFWGLMKPLPVYRIAMVLSTAYRLGAFDGTGLELRRGIGFAKMKGKPELRVIKGGRK